jgi:hypothetical protein
LDCIFRETAKIESDINEMAQLHGGYITDEVYEKMAKKNGHDSVVDFIHDWFLNVRTLLRFGRIQDDENFGFLVINKSSEGLTIEGMGLKEAEKILLQMKREEEAEKAEKAKKAEKAEKAEKGIRKNVIFEEETNIIVYPDKINTLQGRFANLAVRTTTKEIQEEMITIRSQDEKTGKGLMKVVYENIVKYTREELIMMYTDDDRFVDWCNDVVIYASMRQVYYDENICCDEDDKTEVEIREQYTKLLLQLEQEEAEKAEKVRLQLEREIAEKAEKAEKVRLQLEQEEAEKQRIAEIAKAEKKRKTEESEKKAKEASKRNLPPYPPHQKQKSKQDSQMVSNTKAQKEWLKKHVPDWDGLVWSKSQANKYINDIKNGIDVIVCSTIPIAVGQSISDDECDGLVVAEASLPDAVNL